MTTQEANNKALDLLVWIPGRAERRLVHRVTATHTYAQVKQRLSDLWRIPDVEDFEFTYYNDQMGPEIVISTQDEWAYAFSKDFFRPASYANVPVWLQFRKRAAPPSDAE